MTESRDFPLDPLSVGAARRFAKEALAGISEQVLESVVLMVSELATNSIRHAKTGFHLTINASQDAIRVEVTDPAGGAPVVRSPGPDDPTGRGLRIVEAFSDDWGVEHAACDDTTVWFMVSARPSPPESAQVSAQRSVAPAARQ